MDTKFKILKKLLIEKRRCLVFAIYIFQNVYISVETCLIDIFSLSFVELIFVIEDIILE